ncbi:unnamed protein product [Gordionus sp. m RMFG-2023]|uniref:glycine cleavage system H protein-like n=1 Tax=Gordionus sp. m RMFG-2023 TaxID=3053472 RepID=UPI0030E1B30A
MLRISCLKKFPNINKNFHFYTTLYDKLYTKEHEWILVENKLGTVGISDHAQKSLGDIVYIELPDVGKYLKKGDPCGALESVKAASEIYSPITGKIEFKNEEAENKPSIINASCLDKGWLFKISIDNSQELKSLMDEDSYKKFLKSKE